MPTEPALDELLGQLYQGPLEEPPWQGFLASVREALAADIVTLLLRPPSLEHHVEMLADGGSLSAIASYNAGQFVLDPFVNLPSRDIVSLRQFIGEASLRDTDFYRVIMQPQGWHDFLGVDIREAGEMDLRFRAGRYRGAGDFGAAETALLRRLLPHLERAVRLHARINRSDRERAVYAGAVEQLQVATFILDERGQFLSANAAAQSLLSRGDVFALRQQRLCLADRQAQAEFDALLQRVLHSRHRDGAGAADAMQLRRGQGAGTLGLVLRAVPPAPGVAGPGIPCVAVFASDPQLAAQPPQQTVRRLFGLTPTEASLALLLAAGHSLDEAAEELAISRNTARAHLRSVFAKTGVSRQAGLVRLILRSVASLAGSDLP